MATSTGFEHVGNSDSELGYAGNPDRVTLDKGYIDALVRRAQLVIYYQKHQQSLNTDMENKHDTSDPIDNGGIIIARNEYDSLLRISRDYEALRKSLIVGGVDSSTLDILINHSNGNDARKDSALADDQKMSTEYPNNFGASHVSSAPITRTGQPADPAPWREINYEVPSSSDPAIEQHIHQAPLNERIAAQGAGHIASRTLYFSGLSRHTTYKDLFSILKGGRIVSAVLRHDSANVCFANGAASFLAWSKRNNIHLQGKRVEVQWAEHEYRYHSHVADKVSGGATRNLVIRNALRGGLGEHRIREDMEHISHLVIIDVKYQGGDAYIFTNAINYALFARTCMMSRASYRGHKIEFFRDECDVPLPLNETNSLTSRTHSAPKEANKTSISNRFGVLNMDGTEAGSDEDTENRDPDGYLSDDSLSDFRSGFGARLRFQDSDE